MSKSEWNTYANQDKDSPCRHEIFSFEDIPSSLDMAHVLASQDRLRIWDSVFAASQTAGRGQLRRRWHSPRGNIYAALRLPVLPPFSNGAASVAVGLLLVESLSQLGFPVRIKWPNDVVLESEFGPRKIAGILLEERAGILLAGIGINITSCPSKDELRPDAALDAGCLAEFSAGISLPTAEKLWSRLVNCIISVYNNARTFADTWRLRAEAFLLWKSRIVIVADGQIEHKGRLAGLSPSGGLLLETKNGIQECFSGSLRSGSAKFGF